MSVGFAALAGDRNDDHEIVLLASYPLTSRRRPSHPGAPRATRPVPGWAGTATCRGDFAADLLQVQQSPIMGTSDDCRSDMREGAVSVRFEMLARDGAARRGRLTTAHGE